MFPEFCQCCSVVWHTWNQQLVGRVGDGLFLMHKCRYIGQQIIIEMAVVL